MWVSHRRSDINAEFFLSSFFSGKGKKGSIVSPAHLRGAVDWAAAAFSARIKTSKLRQRLKTTTCSLIFLPTQSASLSCSDVCHNTTAAAGSGPASTTPHLEILQKESIILPHLPLLTRTLYTRAFSFFLFSPHRKNFDFSKIENTITPKCPVWTRKKNLSSLLFQGQ